MGFWFIWLLKAGTWTYTLFMLLRITNNLIFIAARRPKVWIAVAGLIGVVPVVAVYALDWGGRFLEDGIFFAAIFSIPPPVPKGMSKKENKLAMRAMYREIGLPYGRLQYRLGLAAFVVCAIVTVAVFFAEACTYGGVCTRPLLQAIG